MPLSLLFTEAGWIAALQTLGAWLVPILIAFTTLGYEEFYLLVVPFTYWCMDSGLGMRLGAMLMFSQATNSLFKLVFHAPRPYWINSDVTAYSAETSFGAPSGHAQISLSMWGAAAAWFRRRWVTILCAVIIFMIGFSRIYLGVHFISDVLIGWIIGGLLLFAVLRWEKPFITRFIRFSLWRQLTLIALGAAFFFCVFGLIQQ
ncbi:MAG TPA: phosphatase PAP2 family protein, partial [Anaerolineaceae bacterium]|nr:phosphatase PAP2 family protein [Anaerolineaceae bacterium]